MNLTEIIKEWLLANGYDGLFHADTECGCGMDDLMPCDQPSLDCMAGIRKICEDEESDFYGEPVFGPRPIEETKKDGEDLR